MAGRGEFFCPYFRKGGTTVMTASGFPTRGRAHPSVRGGSLLRSCREKNCSPCRTSQKARQTAWQRPPVGQECFASIADSRSEPLRLRRPSRMRACAIYYAMRRRAGRRTSRNFGAGRRLGFALDLFAPEGAHAALDGDRRDAAREQVFLAEDRVDAVLGRLGVLAGVHADGVARAGLDAQAADHAAQLVDLEDRRALLDAPLPVSSGTMVMQCAGHTVGQHMQATQRTSPSSRSIRRCRPRKRSGYVTFSSGY